MSHILYLLALSLSICFYVAGVLIKLKCGQFLCKHDHPPAAEEIIVLITLL